MKSVIHDLWYGNICELEACGNNNKIIKKERRACDMCEALAKELLPHQKNMLKQYTDIMYDVHSDHAEAAFTRGVCLGIRLCCEAWLQENP